MTNKIIIKDKIIEESNELEFVDEDIKKVFKGKTYFMGTPSIIQLGRNVKELSELVKPKKYEYKVVQRYGAGWGRIHDDDVKLLEEGWELIHVHIDLKQNKYSIQIKREKSK